MPHRAVTRLSDEAPTLVLLLAALELTLLLLVLRYPGAALEVSSWAVEGPGRVFVGAKSATALRVHILTA